MKNTFSHGLAAGFAAGVVGLIYNFFYAQALVVDFSKVVTFSGILIASVLGCLLASAGYHFLTKRNEYKRRVWFNVLIVFFTLASLAGPFLISLPIDVESPELFIGLAVPLHLFPMLFWLATKPVFEH